MKKSGFSFVMSFEVNVMLEMKTRRLQKAVLCGMLLGLTIPLGAMVFHSHRAGQAEAAILVHDERNIAEAIKTAITTADILDRNTKELALAVINAKKLDGAMLGRWESQNEAVLAMSERFGEWLGDRLDVWGVTVSPETLEKLGKSPAILNQHTTTEDILYHRIGSIEDVLNTKGVILHTYEENSKNHRVLDATYQASATKAQASQAVTKELNQSVLDAVRAADEAEGEQQILQAQIQLSAAQVLQGGDTKDVLANLLAMESERYYVENRARALRETREQASKVGVAKFVG